MKKIAFTLLPAVLLAQFAYADSCANLTGCQKKICELEAKLKGVTEPHAADRIKQAIAQTKANCVDNKVASTAKDAENNAKIDKKIGEAKEDIAEANMKKDKAQAEGKADKVQKYQQKVEEKNMKIKHLQEQKK